MKRHVIFIEALLIVLFTITSGYSYYNPSQGRWLSRDPIGERGFIFRADSFGRKKAHTKDDNEDIIHAQLRALARFVQENSDPEIIAFLILEIEKSRQELSQEQPYHSELVALYTFARNAPMNWVDPMGLSVIPPCTPYWRAGPCWKCRTCFSGWYNPLTGEWEVTAYLECVSA